MGCSGSKEGTPRGHSPRKPWRNLQPTTPSTTERRLVTGLQELKRQMDEENSKYGKDAFSFTKIILKLGTIEKVLRRVKAVFESVDHGNKGHVTKDELKEGLHKAQVDLGDEWEDTNIEECLQHLQGRAEDHDKVGLREFVVMLAVGRVCRPLKRRSTVFVPLQHQHQQGKGNGAVGAGRSRDTSLVKKTIDENEVRRPSLTLDTPYTAEAAAAAAAASEAEEAAVAAAAAAAGTEPLNTEDGDRNSDKTSVIGAGPGDSDTQVAGLLGSATTTATATTTSGEAPATGGAGAGAGVVDLEEREAVAAAASMGDCQGQGHGGPSPTASAGPGGLPRASSWRSLKWAQIPSLKTLDVSMRGMGISRGFSKSGGLAKAGGGRGGGGGGGGGGDDVEVSQSVKYVLDLFIAAYFQFDTTGQGYITKSTVEKTLRQGEREPGASGLLDEKRWSEAAWEGDRLSFQEFIYAFAQWLGLIDEDEDEEDDDNGASYQHKPAVVSAPAPAPAPAPGTAPAPAAQAAQAPAGTVDGSGSKGAALAPASEPLAPASL
eukprot:g8344.t1